MLWFDRPETRYVRAKIGLAGHLDRRLGGRYFQPCSNTIVLMGISAQKYLHKCTFSFTLGKSFLYWNFAVIYILKTWSLVMPQAFNSSWVQLLMSSKWNKQPKFQNILTIKIPYFNSFKQNAAKLQNTGPLLTMHQMSRLIWLVCS